MTFDNVEINMRDMYDYGQVYEVLSKVTSLQGINFTTVSWPAIKIHPACLAYYENNRKTWAVDYAEWIKKEKNKNCSTAQYIIKDNLPVNLISAHKFDCLYFMFISFYIISLFCSGFDVIIGGCC